LEGSVDGKYYLSDKMVDYFNDNKKGSGSGRAGEYLNAKSKTAYCVLSNYYKQPNCGNYIEEPNIIDTTLSMGGGNQEPKVVCFGRSEAEKERRREYFKATGKDSGSFKDKELILKDTEYYDTIIASPNPQKEGLIYSESRVRRLTPTECFRLMDFPDSLVENARNVGISDSQLYKQAGNSIVVGVLYNILKNLKV
jgi:DNA (cytosine-5)-methyltransferase 1